MPMIEQQFRGIGAGLGARHDRRLHRRLGSVRRPGDVSGRLQRRLGALSDPIDFRSYRSVNIYDEHNAYYYEDNPFKRTPKPGYRDYRDHLFSTFEDRNLVELALGTHGRSAASTTRGRRCSDRSATTATTNRSTTRRPARSIREVAIYWRDHYDLRYILQRDWKTLGPKLRGKIHITSGTMDNGYLNNAVYQMEEFLGHAVPSAEFRDHLRRAARALLHRRH